VKGERLDPILRESTTSVLLALTGSLRAAADEELAKLGLRLSHYLLLSVLLPEKALSHALIAERSGLHRNAVGQLVRELAFDGIIKQELDPADGRSRRVRRAGEADLIVADAADAIGRAEARVLVRLSPRERRRLAELARRALPERPHPLAWLFR
jgi:DNA-binding MarR family transcriptional regulator